MNKTVKRYFFISLALCAFLLSSSIAFAWDATGEVRRLNKEAPSIDGFSGAKALIWLKDNEFKMLNDGSMENNRRTIIMMGENIPDSWKKIKLPVPSDGTLEIVEASWYNPMTGLKEGNLIITNEELAGGGKGRVIQTPSQAVGRAVVLNIRETSGKRYGVDNTIDMAGALPIWEQNVSVEMPEGRELYWLARDIKDPRITKTKGTQIYSWKVMNQSAWAGKGFVVYKRPVLSFSSRKGINQSLKEMKEQADSVPLLPFPISISSNTEKAGKSLMEWMQKPERTLVDYPEDFVRPAEQLPSTGPWTAWEQTLILNKWLTKVGWDTSVWWQSETELDKDSPASSTTWSAPVLNITTTKGKKEPYQAGQTSDFGITAPSIAGTTLYTHNDKAYIKEKVSSGNPSEHKLELLWLLTMDEYGIAEGTLNFTATGGWTGLFSSGNMPDKNNLSEFLADRINFAIPGMQLTPIDVVPTKTGYTLKFEVKCPAGILHANNLLLRLPGGIPVRVGEMIGENTEYTFRFPFVMVQKVRMDMPKGYHLVQQPTMKNIGGKSKAVLTESIVHWPKKAQLIADSKWTVKTTTVDAALATILKEELAACLRWPMLDLPFRKGK